MITQLNFVDEVTKVIKALGGVERDDSYYHKFCLNTKYGPLFISLKDTDKFSGGTFFSCFIYSHLATEHLGCNSYSGKWNHHYHYNSAEFAVVHITTQLHNIKPTSLHEFCSKTSLVLDVIVKIVVEDRNVDLTDPVWMWKNGLSHEQSLHWFINHIKSRLVFLYDTNKRIREIFEGEDARDTVYAFVEHWLDEYIDNIPKYRRENSLETMKLR
jgi:hypothetical protein